MAYLDLAERDRRLARMRDIMAAQDLDVALVYYDEFNIGNGWYLTGWCPQFESGAVLVPRVGEPMLLGGPESEPFAKFDSAVKDTRNFTVFMVPNEEYPNATITDFPALFDEMTQRFGPVRRVGLVGGGRMPAACYQQIVDGFEGVQLVDMTDEFVALRFVKSPWEMEQIRA
ncbi:MAG TPA: aminopeptidase P family N-terminal domain-containing protein, partial [Armatimonadota bacterium]|nr:aminopeptidase P family N-terminal domain-containing protein [Armatimonadota bacterium]